MYVHSEILLLRALHWAIIEYFLKNFKFLLSSLHMPTWAKLLVAQKNGTALLGINLEVT